MPTPLECLPVGTIEQDSLVTTRISAGSVLQLITCREDGTRQQLLIPLQKDQGGRLSTPLFLDHAAMGLDAGRIDPEHRCRPWRLFLCE